jgi:penicillin amidase
MRGVIKYPHKILAAVVLIAAIVVCVGYVFLSLSIPPYSGDFSVKGIHDKVKIVRDRYGVPHISSLTEGSRKHDEDVYFALGFVHAQDRIWQMEIRRKAMQGRLSELLGNKKLSDNVTMIDVDHLMRSLDLYSYAAGTFRLQASEVQGVLSAYTRGVNAWLDHLNSKIFRYAAPEFIVFPGKIEPWTELDSLAALKLVALDLSRESATSEIEVAQFLLGVDSSMVRDLFFPLNEQSDFELPRLSQLLDTEDFSTEKETQISAFEKAFFESTGASNAWAVSPSRSATRASFLASDPHLALTAPAVWYAAHMELSHGNVIGATIPGIPAVISGRNDNVAWGMTYLHANTQDIYVERTNSNNKNQYLTPKGWFTFQEKITVIHSRNSPSVRVKLRKTRHGPVIPLEMFRLTKVIPKGHVAALAWSGFTHYDFTFRAFLGLMNATSIGDAKKAVEDDNIFISLNIFFADKNNVGFSSIGTVPIRSAANITGGKIPSPGWLADYDWIGTLPRKKMPKNMGRVVANTNNPVGINQKSSGNPKFGLYRMRRLQELLDQYQYHSLSGTKTLQNDTVSAMAKEILPLISAKIWWEDKDSDRDNLSHKMWNDALNILAEWDYDMDQYQVAPLIFYSWMSALVRRITNDELGSLAKYYTGMRPHFIHAVFSDTRGASRWCDIVQTAEKESCAEIASLALNDALQSLRFEYKSDISRWRWGWAHMVVSKHIPFGYQKALSWLFNVEHVMGGGDYTLMRFKISNDAKFPYQSFHGGAFRAVYDFSDLNRSQFSMSTGQSGHFLSEYYDNFSQIWKVKGYAPLTTDFAEISSGNAGVISLERKPEKGRITLAD